MITVDSIKGNIFRSPDLKSEYDRMCANNICETIKISRLESQRVRMRKVSDKGTDIALVMPSGTTLRHGDIILSDKDKMVVLEIEPEDVAMIEIKSRSNKENHDHGSHNNNDHHSHHSHNDDSDLKIPLQIGHTIGNLHRPIKIQGNKVYFPIQADSEIDMFKKLFGSIMNHMEIKKTRLVFEPEQEMNVHEH